MSKLWLELMDDAPTPSVMRSADPPEAPPIATAQGRKRAVQDVAGQSSAQKRSCPTVCQQRVVGDMSSLGPTSWIGRVQRALTSTLAKQRQRCEIVLHTACSGTGSVMIGLKAPASVLVLTPSLSPDEPASVCLPPAP